eukprot:Awhi_evm3s2448
MADSSNYQTGDLNMIHLTYDALFIESLLYYSTFCYTIAEIFLAQDFKVKPPSFENSQPLHNHKPMGRRTRTKKHTDCTASIILTHQNPRNSNKWVGGWYATKVENEHCGCSTKAKIRTKKKHLLNEEIQDQEAEDDAYIQDLASAAPDLMEFDLDNVRASELDKEHRFNLSEEANNRLGKALDDVIRSAYVTVPGDEHLRPIPESEIYSRLTSANKKLISKSKNNIKFQLLLDTILARILHENNNVVIAEDSNDLVMDPPRAFSSQKSNKRTKHSYEHVYASSSQSKRSKTDVVNDLHGH